MTEAFEFPLLQKQALIQGEEHSEHLLTDRFLFFCNYVSKRKASIEFPVAGRFH